MRTPIFALVLCLQIAKVAAHENPPMASNDHRQCSQSLVSYYKSMSVSDAKDLCTKYGGGAIAFVLRRGSEFGGDSSDEHKFDLVRDFGVDTISFVIANGRDIPSSTERHQYELTKQFGIKAMKCAIQKNKFPVYGKSFNDLLWDCLGQ